MIDTTSEQLVSLTEAATLFPRRRAGKKPHVTTLHRWVTAGCRGVRLEYIMVGGTRCTSREAIQRFCEKLTAGDGTSAPTTTKRRQREIDTAKGELAAAGYV